MRVINPPCVSFYATSAKAINGRVQSSYGFDQNSSHASGPHNNASAPQWAAL